VSRGGGASVGDSVVVAAAVAVDSSS